MEEVETIRLGADRGVPFVIAFWLPGYAAANLSILGQVRLIRDAPGPPRISLETVTTPNTQGFRVLAFDAMPVLSGIEKELLSGLSEVVSDPGVPCSVIIMRIDEAVITALPAAPELGQDAEFEWDAILTVNGFPIRKMEGPFIARAGVSKP